MLKLCMIVTCIYTCLQYAYHSFYNEYLLKILIFALSKEEYKILKFDSFVEVKL